MQQEISAAAGAHGAMRRAASAWRRTQGAPGRATQTGSGATGFDIGGDQYFELPFLLRFELRVAREIDIPEWPARIGAAGLRITRRGGGMDGRCVAFAEPDRRNVQHLGEFEQRGAGGMDPLPAFIVADGTGRQATDFGQFFLRPAAMRPCVTETIAKRTHPVYAAVRPFFG